MRDHPIPQDITAYRFHIVGNMTIKQFAEVGAGCLLGVLLYATNLPFIIKWPLITASVAIGAMMAFVPIEERPLDHWIVTFFKVLYRPTQFFWKREPRIPDPFLFKQNTNDLDTTVDVDYTPIRRQRVKDFFNSYNRPAEQDGYDQAEQARLAEIMQTFRSGGTLGSGQQGQLSRPTLSVRVRSLKIQGQTGELYTGVDSIQDNTAWVEASPTAATDSVQPDYQAQLLTRNKSIASVESVAQEIAIPTQETIAVDDALTADAQTTTQELAPAQPTTPELTLVDNSQALPAYTPVTLAPSQTAHQNLELPFPSPPTEPNKLVGMILSTTNDLLESAIVEIRAEDGRVVRAVRANALGQFFVTTPLANGTYTLMAEKDGYTFTPQQIALTGQVVSPIEIRGSV